MEATQSTTAINNKKRKKGNQDCKNSNSSRVLSTPRTRSQVSPEWTAKQALILVNEIAAVDKDSSKAVSTNQKWKIIVGNCVALDVTHTLSQCRSKWNSLVIEYNQIKKWDKESESRSDFYWSLGCERRKEFGLPENFDDELFKAIDDYMWSQKEQLDTDPDNDLQKADLLDVIANLGAKKQRKWLTSLKTHTEEKTHKCCRKENSQTIHAEEEPQKRHEEENSQIYCTMESPHGFHAEEECQESQVQENTQTCCSEGKLQTIHADDYPWERCAEEEPHTIHAEEWLQPCCSKEKPQTIHVQEENQERYVEENHQTCCTKEKPQTIPAEEELHEIQVKEKPQKPLRKEKPQIGSGDEKPKIYSGRKKMPSTEDMEQLMVEKLSENAEMIQAVVNGNLPEMADVEAADSNNIEGFKTDLIRSQGDKLIACLENIVNTMRQFPWLLQDATT
ncbi:PREDICTED: uncharacterized protein LOC105109831 isoform X1 [Populus euphratica]|uniref:Uncharacterized protein LOC105109831 isoform X1 n=1 Tax=Populus euphratica TaxID=75702 RepID=A0AAJ6T2G0_POPEU|nr:PREDICTED: uncharacterized protein LOC105109831 isoform X1 [Populus euphratica]